MLLRRLGRRSSSLRAQLERDGKTKWLDIGGYDISAGFECYNLLRPENLTPEQALKYRQMNILETTGEEDIPWGQFDLVRMQHVLEHFSYEDDPRALEFCAKMLKPGGYLLITVPDLRLAIASYLTKGIFGRHGYHYVRKARSFDDDVPPSPFMRIRPDIWKTAILARRNVGAMISKG